MTTIVHWNGTAWAAAAGGGTVDPPAPLWRKPEIGTMGADESAFQLHDSRYGPVVARRTYNTTLPGSFASSSASSDVAAGRHSFWSWKPDLTGFPTSTSQKNAFSAFVDTIPAGHRTTIVAWHEPEDNIASGDFTLRQWGILQETVAGIVHSKGRPELRYGICLMGPWTFDSRSPHYLLDWDNDLDWSVIDVIGIDPYRTTVGSTASLETMLTVPNSGSAPGAPHPSMFGKLLQYNRPISLMEWGCYNATEAAVVTFINDAYAWFLRWNQAHPADTDGPVDSALWFDHTLTTTDNPLTGIEITAYAGIVADSKIPPTS